MNLLITINSHIAAPHIQIPPFPLFMWQPKLPPATSALLGEFCDQPPGRRHAAIFSLQGRACRSASWKTDAADLSLASRMQKTSMSAPPLLRGGNTCHFLSQLQLACCISALIDPEPPNTANQGLNETVEPDIIFHSFRNTDLFVFLLPKQHLQ